MATAFIVTNGPGHFDFFASLSEGDSDHRKEVRFHLNREGALQAEYHVDLAIDMAGREDGSGCSWNLKGRHWPNKVNPMPVNCTGWYNTKTRTGRLVFEA